MQIVSRRNMLALPVERLVGNSSTTTSGTSSSSPSSPSHPSPSPPPRPPVTMSPDSSASDCSDSGRVKKPRLFTPFSIGGGDSRHMNNSPNRSADSRQGSPNTTATTPPPPPPSNNKESLISSTSSDMDQDDEVVAHVKISNSPSSSPPPSSSSFNPNVAVKEERESQLVLVNPSSSSPPIPSSSILEKMQTSIRIIETQLQRNPPHLSPASALFNNHYHNDDNNNNTDNESGDENNRPASTSSSATVLSGTALSPNSESAFRPAASLNPHHLHYHHYYHHHHYHPGSPSPTRSPNNNRIPPNNITSPPRSSNNNTSSSLHLKFSIDDILKPEFGKGALQKSPINNNAKRPLPAEFTNHHRSSTANSSSSLGSSKPHPPHPAQLHSPLGSHHKSSSSLRTTLGTSGSSRASSVKDYSEDSNGSCTSRKEEVVDESKVNPTVPQGPLLWPAWVYCTRYSDRPSSGPRSRRVRKNEAGPKPPTVRDPTEEKRPRTAFTAEQLSRLKQEFDENRYLTEKRRQDLARDLKLHENQIKIWFQNKRAKLKKSTGTRGGLAMQLMAQGLYNHSTVPIDEDDEMYEAMMAQQ